MVYTDGLFFQLLAAVLAKDRGRLGGKGKVAGFEEHLAVGAAPVDKVDDSAGQHQCDPRKGGDEGKEAWLIRVASGQEKAGEQNCGTQAEQDQAYLPDIFVGDFQRDSP